MFSDFSEYFKLNDFCCSKIDSCKIDGKNSVIKNSFSLKKDIFVSRIYRW